MKTISLRLPDDIDQALNAAAKKQGMSKSNLVREALQAHLRNGGKPQPRRSILELAGDLIGSMEGPPDLSTNEKYMEGFGE